MPVYARIFVIWLISNNFNAFTCLLSRLLLARFGKHVKVCYTIYEIHERLWSNASMEMNIPPRKMLVIINTTSFLDSWVSSL